TVLAPFARAPWTYTPPVALTALTAGGRRLVRFQSGAEVELAPGARDVTVEFAALDYSAPEAVRYAYRLEGYNSAWIEADPAHRLATYTNLSPGAYTLRVRGTNRLGAWSTSTLALRVRALPAWWETGWFRALLGVLAAAVVLGVVRARTRVLQR